MKALAVVSTLYLVIMLAWGHQAHWGLHAPERAAVLLAVVLSFLTPLVFPRCWRSHRVRSMLFTYVMLIVFSNFSAALGYFLVTTDAPLVDATLARWDLMLGFDWVAFCGWIQQHAWADLWLKYAYKSFIIQFPLMVVYLSLTRRFTQLSDFCGGMVVSMIITHVSSWFYPAAGAGKYNAAQLAVDMSALSDFEPLRSGALRHIDPTALQGLISIPSYHTVLAVLFTCAFRHTRIFWPILIANISMILATPKFGGHYVMDVLTGFLTVVVSIYLWQRITRPNPGSILPIAHELK
ncbi:hypothetical protein GJ699_11570 [Duganella sp. FT80W]|uniref:Inositolphosphotransferase Aur1/Ipt1 domain-containing protein n=1 Tax=Duganella guangzhouensis TaxID=2666084 RepID=A0A6I2L0B4_9BURK|nr:phosphatase PAP2 family protein [Duganella guangzhouensis]MRW90627.1 hypothetical protein [Duganella guangzhouensis]